jgi:hypothetical protein
MEPLNYDDDLTLPNFFLKRTQEREKKRNQE